MNIDLTQIPNDKTTIQFDDISGERLRSIIISKSGMSWNQYLSRIEMAPQNVHNYLSGRNRISLQVLQKLISGTDLCLNSLLELQITDCNGSNVKDATFMQPEEMLSGIDSDFPIEEE